MNDSFVKLLFVFLYLDRLILLLCLVARRNLEFSVIFHTGLAMLCVFKDKNFRIFNCLVTEFRKEF